VNRPLAPVLVVGTVFISLGVGTFLSALNVAYRDFRYVTPFLMQLWMFATPIAYPASLVPVEWRWAFYINPVAGLIEGFRSVFLGRPMDLEALAISMVVAATIFFAGVIYFENAERRFADII